MSYTRREWTELIPLSAANLNWMDLGIARTHAQSLTTAERNALAGDDLFAGRVIYNTTTAQVEIYTGAAWVSKAAVGLANVENRGSTSIGGTEANSKAVTNAAGKVGHALIADSVPDGAITSSKLGALAVIAGKIADGAVDTLARIASALRTSAGGTETGRLAVTHGTTGRVGDSALLAGNTIAAVRSGTTKTDVGLANVDNLKQLPIAGGDLTGEVNHQDNLSTRPKLKDYSEELVTANTGTGYAINLQNANVFELTLTGNCTFTFTNPPATGNAGSFTLILKQDGTGNREVTWPASVRWANGAAPVLDDGTNEVSILTFITTNAGTAWYGFSGGTAFAVPS